MRIGRATAGVAVGIAILLTGAASAALEPGADEAATHASPPAPSHADPHHSPAPTSSPEPTDTARPHTVRIHVSGPDDTLMRVVRDGRGSEVALGGEPFEHSFTEPADSEGHLGIQVAAASKQAGRPAVQCRITVDGAVVARQRAVTRDETGLAQVRCTVPRGV
ncbi:hypothetical protein GCM10009676_34010 [Prauserella halophila]|uniref:MmpS family membrane protein n=1 Tax=Prauserella halophila TaxID=185641 RepID=A0ABN1WC52_9PSEU|nr:hypothetical protein [Prauserella halophila]MCP2237118.1 hypothetical protein [Prauserella halophila]